MFCTSGWLSVPISPYKWSFTVLQFEVLIPMATRSKAPYTLSFKLSYFTVLRHTWRKNCVNYAVLTGNNAGLRTVLSTRLSHRELRSSPKESHSFLSLLVDTTMASSQGTSVSSNSFNRWASHDIFLFKHHFFMCCVLSGRGLCDELITRPEESYRLWYFVVCDLETLRMRRPWPAWGRSATGKENNNKLKSLKISAGKCFSSPIWLWFGQLTVPLLRSQRVRYWSWGTL